MTPAQALVAIPWEIFAGVVELFAIAVALFVIALKK